MNIKSSVISLPFQIIPILHLGRSGSTHFEHLVKNTFNFLSISELGHRERSTPFLPSNLSWNNFFGDDVFTMLQYSIIRTIEVDYWMALSESRTSWSGPGIIFEYKPTIFSDAFHSLHGAFFQDLIRVGIKKVIVIERRSVLRRILSNIIASKTAIYHRTKNCIDQSIVFDRFYLDVNNIFDDGLIPGVAHTLVECQALNDLFFQKTKMEFYSNGFEVLWLTYEDDIASDESMLINKVSSFIDVAPCHVPTSLFVKTGRDNIAEILINSDEVIDYCNRHDIRI